VPSGVLYTDTDVKRTGAAELQELWLEARRDNRKPAVLHGARFEPLSIKPEESQFIDTIGANVRSIARVYGVPSEMIEGNTAGPLAYTSPEMRSIDFLTWSIRPWLVKLERAISGLLPRTQYVRFNAGGMVRASLKDRYEAHRIAIEAGFLTVNEVRELEDLPPLAAPAAPPGGTVA
jgi:HK97 family phage portal protein